MTAGQIKGALLEHLVRKLLLNCGFSAVRPDGHYIYEQSGTGLFYINGKGAAHDADVLMEPPIQIPFSYPSRILFECKSYENKIGLNVIRNALGLRYDINDFEIITDESIQKRKNNRRGNYAISDRKRYNYQVGVASVEPFSPAGFEFAANNKIPLLCLRWMLPDQICDMFHTISEDYLKSFSTSLRRQLYSFLKNKNRQEWDASVYSGLRSFLEGDSKVGEIIRSFDSVVNSSFVGLIETGDLIFLFSESDSPISFERNAQNATAQIHYNSNSPNQWELEFENPDRRGQRTITLKFIVPERIIRMWKEYSYDRTVAINLKERYFSRIFLFKHNPSGMGMPFITVNIDREWLSELRERE